MAAIGIGTTTAGLIAFALVFVIFCVVRRRLDVLRTDEGGRVIALLFIGATNPRPSGRMVAIQTGGPGRGMGRGSIRAWESVTTRPTWVTGVPRQSAVTISTPSSRREMRSAAGGYAMPWLRHTAAVAGSSAPMPNRKSSRPSERWSMATARLASQEG